MVGNLKPVAGCLRSLADGPPRPFNACVPAQGKRCMQFALAVDSREPLIGEKFAGAEGVAPQPV
jgi:hypothetical protein